MRYLFFLCATLISISCQSQDAGWQLSWAEEFDYAGHPNTSYWSHEEGMVRNNEAQYYTREKLANAEVKDGFLVLTAIKEQFDTANYTSASIHTAGKKEFLYGKMEVRAKLPTGRGMWPAIWMLGNNIGEVGWPECGEIDIMENVGYDPDVIHANVHTTAYNHAVGTAKGKQFVLQNPHEDFHVYSVEWFEDRIDIFVDSNQYFSFQNENKTTAEWPFEHPHYLLLNIAVGGGWGGQQGIDDSVFPQQMMVDYVRYYEWK